MPLWDDYKAEAKARGALAFELYMVLSAPRGDPTKLKETLPDHLAYQAQLEEQGSLFLAGPVSDEAGAEMEGMGLIIYRAASMDEARELAEADPMHVRGARSYTLRRWLVNEGSLSLSVRFAGQTAAMT
ncbi:MAG: YciI family protein [Pseudomonadota bacterium]